MALLNLEITFPNGFKYPDFDIKTLKKGLRKNGSLVAKEAKRLVSKKGVSEPGEYPGRQSGALRRSIKAKVSRPGYTVTVKPYKIPAMGEHFYPAYVYYGHRKPKVRTAKDDRDHRKTVGEKVAQPRANFVIDAGNNVGKGLLFKNLTGLMNEALAAKEIRFR